MSSIKAALIIRVSDGQLLFQKCFFKKNIDQDIQIVQDHMTQINPRAEERVTLKTGNGKWCYKLDENRIAYALLSIETYPDRQIWAMIKVLLSISQEIEKELKKMPDYSNSYPQDIEKYTKIWMKQLHEKYDNLTGVDKVAAAQSKVEEVQLIMEDNIHNMINNGQQIDVISSLQQNLDEKAAKMKDQSKQFQQQAHDLAKIMYWRNMKLKIAIGLIVLAVLLYIIVPLAISASN